MVEILVPISLFLAVFGIVYVVLNTRKQERMALIEKGYDASLFASKKTNQNNALKWGLLLVGVALGVFTGYLVQINTTMEPPINYFMMVALFGGIGLLVYYFIMSKKKGNEE